MKTIKVTTSSQIPKDFTGIVEYDDGEKEWYKEGKCHREDGPAVELVDGTKIWYKEGKRHRLDGPAVEYRNGHKEWWIEGNQLNIEILIYDKIFVGKEKGKHGLEWLRFLTEDKIEEYPIVPGHKYNFVEIKRFTLEEFLNRKM